MLRITIHDNSESLTFQLEGRLMGPWVEEVEKSWRAARACHPQAAPRIDLTAVTFIDSPGKAFLTFAHHQGAEFIVADCLMKAIVSEVSQGRGREIPRLGARNC